MKLYAKWEIGGVVQERRELKSEKNREWRGYVMKIATLGQTFEIQVNEEVYKRLAIGNAAIFTGSFEEFGGRLRFNCESANLQEDPAAAAASPRKSA